MELARFKTTASGGGWRSLKDYVGALRENQTAIYYVTGSDLARLEASPQLEGFRARGIEVLLLPDPVDSFWVTAGVDYEGKPFKSVTQGAADLALIPLIEAKAERSDRNGRCDALHRTVKVTLGEQVADVRASERLTESAVCLVAPESGMDRQLERLLARAGQLGRRRNRFWRSTRTMISSWPWRTWAKMSRRCGRMPPICCWMRPGSWTASCRPTRGRSRSGSRG